MKIRSITPIAFSTAAAALIAWGSFGMFAWNIWNEEASIRSNTNNAETVTERQSASLRLHSLARETKSARDRLDSLTGSEVLGIANIIEGIGKSTGVAVTISGAIQSSPAPKSKTTSSILHPIILIIEAEGSFASLMHTAELLENLPILSSLQSLELDYTQNYSGSVKTKKQVWRLSARIQIMTTANVSS
ncbi:MAG: hypothetical protein NUV88_02580 [Candidatus Kaiserbacteria bacterium]|nr:hypothetical protein [Candidatus Kaiserbacteria bacterium]